MTGAIDLRLADPTFQGTTLAQHGITNESGVSLKDVLSSLDLMRVTPPKNPSAPRSNGKSDLTGHLASLLSNKALSEVVGSRVLLSQSVAHYSTLVTRQPRPYFATYCRLLDGILLQTGLPAVVWLEDVACLPRFHWSVEDVAEAADSTSRWFQEHGTSHTVLLSSEHDAGIVPSDFVDNVLGRFDMSEFLGILPFHKRHPSLIFVSDLSHCVWGAYVFSRFPGLHLAGANSKRNYVIYRKLLGKAYSVALLPVEATA